jgi:ABC-type branched-subunit amino acid transport system substrate-binding protein
VTKEVTGEEAKKQLAGEEDRKERAITEAATKEHNDDDFSLEEYLAEMTKIAAAQKKARYERSCNKAAKEATNGETIKDEAAMKARFEEWMREYGKRYRNKEEKARRYELFRAFAHMVDRANAQGGAVFVTNHTADWTEEECQCLYDTDVDWDDYIYHIRSLIDKQNAKAMKARRD